VVRRIIIVVLSILALATLVLSLWSYRETVFIVKPDSGIVPSSIYYAVEFSAGHLTAQRNDPTGPSRTLSYDHRWGGFILSQSWGGTSLIRNPSPFPPSAPLSTALTIPAWALLVLFAAYPIFALYRWLPHRGRRVGCCRHCGYDLTGLPSPRCPECGREFDPERLRRDRQQLHDARARAVRWLAGYRASRRRRIVSALSLCGWVTGLALWGVSCFRVGCATRTLGGRIAWGNLILYWSPGSPHEAPSRVAPSVVWTFAGFHECETMWRPQLFRKNHDVSVYVPLWIPTLACAVGWGLAYRPLYRLRWRGVEEMNSVTDRDVGSGQDACSDAKSG
jgi:hypothetical protein